jgi:hypothetical protein
MSVVIFYVSETGAPSRRSAGPPRDGLPAQAVSSGLRSAMGRRCRVFVQQMGHFGLRQQAKLLPCTTAEALCIRVEPGLQQAALARWCKVRPGGPCHRLVAPPDHRPWRGCQSSAKKNESHRNSPSAERNTRAAPLGFILNGKRAAVCRTPGEWRVR